MNAETKLKEAQIAIENLKIIQTNLRSKIEELYIIYTHQIHDLRSRIIVAQKEIHILSLIHNIKL